MNTYTINVKWDSTYEITAENEDDAIEQAIQYFQECEPEVEVISPDDDEEVKTYSFHDEDSGEDFFVEARSEEEAMTDAKEYFTTPICYGVIPWEEAEMLGWDTY